MMHSSLSNVFAYAGIFKQGFLTVNILHNLTDLEQTN